MSNVIPFPSKMRPRVIPITVAKQPYSEEFMFRLKRFADLLRRQENARPCDSGDDPGAA